MDFVNNAFSLQMLKEDCTIRVSHLKKWEFDQAKKDCVSVIGHKESHNPCFIRLCFAIIVLD